MTHTKTPWRVSDHQDKRHREFAIMADAGGKDGDGGKIASIWAGFGHHFDFAEAEANAAFICRAANSHERMVEALERARAFIESVDEGQDVSGNTLYVKDELAQIDAALAAAKGE